jgi:hypothetical protein
LASELKAAIRDTLLAVGVFLVASAAAGWAWHALWAPAPEATGYIVATGKPVFASESYIRATGLYTVLAAAVGLVLGIVFAFLRDRDEVATLAGVVVGAVAGGRLMAELGNWLGPDDPPAKVTTNEELAQVVAALHAEELAIWTAMPVAAVAGALVVYLSFVKRHSHAASAE